MPDEAVRLLSENYSSVAQTANLLCDCLVMSGVDVNQIQERVEGSLRQLLVNVLSHNVPMRCLPTRQRYPSLILYILFFALEY